MSLILQRPKVSADIKQVLNKTLGEYGIDVVDVSVVNYSFGAEYSQAIANKSLVSQQIETAKLNTQKIEIEGNNNVLAEQKAAEVRRIVAQQDDRNLRFYELQIQDKAVSKWDGHTPTALGSNNLFSIPLAK